MSFWVFGKSDTQPRNTFRSRARRKATNEDIVLLFPRINVSRTASAARDASAIYITASAGRRSRRGSPAAGIACAQKGSLACSEGAKRRSRPAKKVCIAKWFTLEHSQLAPVKLAPLKIGFDRAE